MRLQVSCCCNHQVYIIIIYDIIYDLKITKKYTIFYQYKIYKKISFRVYVKNSSNFLVNDNIILHF